MIDFNLRAGYLNAGFSRRGFADHIGIAEQSLRRLESGEPIHPANAKKIADFFGLKVTDLMPIDNGDHDPKPMAA